MCEWALARVAVSCWETLRRQAGAREVESGLFYASDAEKSRPGLAQLSLTSSQTKYILLLYIIFFFSLSQLKNVEMTSRIPICAPAYWKLGLLYNLAFLLCLFWRGCVKKMFFFFFFYPRSHSLLNFTLFISQKKNKFLCGWTSKSWQQRGTRFIFYFFVLFSFFMRDYWMMNTI